jgi:hypothetical protein
MKYVLIIFLLLTSCESKRASRKVKWLEDRGYLIKDTIHLHDTLNGFFVDTIYIGTKEVDTFTLVQNNVQVRTIVKWKDRFAVQELIVKDTVITTVYKTLTKTIKEKRKYWDRFHLGFAFASLIIATIIGILFRVSR